MSPARAFYEGTVVAIDSDNPVSLPTPPPPRPAARREAIDAALRKFDGEETAAPLRPARRFGWGGMDRRAIGALATAAIVAAISIPVAVMTLRDFPQPQAQAPRPADVEQSVQAPADASDSPVQAEPPAATAAVAEAAVQEATRTQPGVVAPEARRDQMALAERKTIGATAAPVVAAAPPPPPAAPAPQRSEEYAAEAAGAQDMVVTGSRVRTEALGNAAPVAVIDTYGDFLSKLQAGLRSGNRRAVSGLVGFPLTVRRDGRVETYRSRREVERDFDEIFSARVRSEVLSQRPYSLRTRDDGRTRGSSRLWFAPACFNPECSPPGPVRIREVSP